MRDLYFLFLGRETQCTGCTGVAFIDVNTNQAVPKLLAGLSKLGLAPSEVRYIIITHVHLDHSGKVSIWSEGRKHSVCWLVLFPLSVVILAK